MAAGGKFLFRLFVLVVLCLSGGSVFSFYSLLYEQSDVAESTVFLVEKGESLNRIAERIGFEPYQDPAPLEEAFVRVFYDPEKELFCDSDETTHISLPGNVFAAFFELFPTRAGVGKTIAMIREKRLSQSLFFETFPLLAFLAREGETQLIHELLTDENAWLKMIDEGATRTFEGWSKDLKWNTSLFHLTLTLGALFLTEWDVGGILRFSR